MSLKVKENNTIKNVAGSETIEHSNYSVDSSLNSLSENPVDKSVIESSLTSVKNISTTTYDPDEYGVKYDTSEYITKNELDAQKTGFTDLATELTNKINARNTLVDGVTKGYFTTSSNISFTTDSNNTTVTGDTQIFAPDFRNSYSYNEASITAPRVYSLNNSSMEFLDVSTAIDMSKFVNMSADGLIVGDRFDFFATEDVYAFSTSTALPWNTLKLKFGNTYVETNYLPFHLGNYEATLAGSTTYSSSFFYNMYSGRTVFSNNFIDYVNNCYGTSFSDSARQSVRCLLCQGVTFCFYSSPSSYRVVHMKPLLNAQSTNYFYQRGIVATANTGFSLIYDGTIFRVLGNPLMVNIPFGKVFNCNSGYTGYNWDDDTITGYLKYRADSSWSFDGVFPTTNPNSARASGDSTNTWRLYLPIWGIGEYGKMDRIVQLNGFGGINTNAAGTYPLNNKMRANTTTLLSSRDTVMNPNTSSSTHWQYIISRVEKNSNDKFMTLKGKMYD